jgi:hypothetical protein
MWDRNQIYYKSDFDKIILSGPTPVAGLLDRHGVSRSGVFVYRDGFVVDGTMMSIWGGVLINIAPHI